MVTPRQAVVVLAAAAAWFGVCRHVAMAGERSAMAMWSFDRGPENGAYPGTGHPARLRGGAVPDENGRSGACLRPYRGTPTTKTPGGVTVDSRPELSPNGPFTLEVSICPDEAFFSATMAFLLDKKFLHYPSAQSEHNRDYQLHLTPSSDGRWVVTAYLGFGEDSSGYRSRPIVLEAGTWSRIAFTYDGAGTGRIYQDGLMVSETHHPGRGGIAAGDYPLVIGDRVGPDYYPFPGRIDQVRIVNRREVFHSGKLLIKVGRPQAFLRMSRPADLRVALRNDLHSSFSGGTLNATVAGQTVWSAAIDDIEENGRRVYGIPVDTSLRPGTYKYRLAIYGRGQRDQALAAREVDVSIVSRPPPVRMPVVMWGHADVEKVQEAGFTHSFVTLVNCPDVWREGIPADTGMLTEDPAAETLDQALVDGFGVVAYIGAGRFLNRTQADLRRVDRLGNRDDEDRNVCGLFPQAQAFCYNAGAAIAIKYGVFPALEAAIVESETRGGTSLCYHPHDDAAFREFAGCPPPDDVDDKSGTTYSALPGFPVDRIIPDNDPRLTYLRWFWEQGDGWNPLFTQIHRGLKSTGLDGLWTWYDPAVRVPSTAGSGGEVDVISQWTYCYPDPIKIGRATDELLAMAELSPNKQQQVMKMTQMIWYRSYTAPKREAGQQTDVPVAAWEKAKPDANYITIAPDHLREAFWSKISRPIAGVMYFGWWSLVDEEQDNPYMFRHTNPESRHVLRELIETVVTPLGPTLVQVPDSKSDVAFLQSFASEMFAGVGEFGWGWGWGNDAYQILRYAHLQPQVVFEQTILRNGLDDFRVLVLVKCPVLTRNVANAIVAFQDRGGIIIGDENLAPGIDPDVLLRTYERTKRPDEDKAVLQARASELTRTLAPFYVPAARSDTPDVLVRLRRYGTTDYLFALNDKRTFGDYVGQFGLVMEKGLPCDATITVRRPAGVVYDLVAHRRVGSALDDGALKISTALGPGGGHVYLVTETGISAVTVTGKQRVGRGRPLHLDIAVVGRGGDPIKAVVPVRVDVRDPRGETGEFSGYYGAKDGRLRVSLDMAPNDVPGKWIVEVEELASARRARHGFELVP